MSELIPENVDEAPVVLKPISTKKNAVECFNTYGAHNVLSILFAQGLGLYSIDCSDCKTIWWYSLARLLLHFSLAKKNRKKLAELQTVIHSWTGRKCCTQKELESLIGW